MSLFLVTYRLALRPLLQAGFRGLARFHPKIRKGLELRAPDSQGRPPWLRGTAVAHELSRPSPQQRLPMKVGPVWIHCASGEFEYAKPVIRALKAQNPSIGILVTYFSPSVASAVEKFPGVDFACPLPWDRPRDLQAFLEHHRPRCLLIARTDTWPEMLHQTRARGIPSLLFSATLSPQSGRAKGLGRWVSRSVFSDLTQIFCVTDEDVEVFASLGFADRTRVAGDTRYDQVQARLQSPKPVRDELFAGSADSKDARPLLIAGSTWDEDENVLIEVASRLKEKIRFVLVPHEPTKTHLAQLEEKIQGKGARSTRYSKAQSWKRDEILLIDQIGILAELYLKGRFAFVGGSFRKTVHSVMEPLAAGCLTFVGPKHGNNREALEFKTIKIGQTGLTCVEAVSGADEMVQRLEQALNSFAEGEAAQIRSEIKERSGKSRLVAEWALKF